MQIAEADVKMLTEIFPDTAVSHIQHMHINAELSLDIVVEFLLERQPSAVRSTTQSLLENLATQVTDFSNDVTIIVNRHCLFNKAKV